MPRSGKTTLLNKIIQQHNPKFGFVTNEIRKDGERVGFEIVTHDGKKALLAHVDFDTPIQVSRYKVDVSGLDALLPEMYNFALDDFLYLDEIGQMSLYSDNFKPLALAFLDSPNICVAIVSKIYSDEFIEAVKQRDDSIVVKLTEENRAEQGEYIQNYIQKLIKK